MNLDRIVQFRRATFSDDGFGEAETWGDHGFPVRAEKQEISDGERWRAGEVAAHISCRFIVRWTPFTGAITPVDRLICEAREYDISGIKEIGRREYLEITAAARAD